MKITILNKPIAKKRPRFTRTGIAYNSQKTVMSSVRTVIKSQWNRDPIEGAVQIKLTFIMPIPKSTKKEEKSMMMSGSIYHTKRPDIDNLAKFILDCMNGIVYIDDSQIAHTEELKLYGENPRTEIDITELKTPFIG